LSHANAFWHYAKADATLQPAAAAARAILAGVAAWQETGSDGVWRHGPAGLCMDRDIVLISHGDSAEIRGSHRDLPGQNRLNVQTTGLGLAPMNLARPITFWIAMCAAIIAAVVLLREILLPFVAGLVLAYLFNPLANRLERLGFNRLLAALTIIGLFIVGVVALVSLTAPIIARELALFLDNLPLYFGQLKTLTSDPSRPWLRKIVGEGLGSAEQSIGELATLGVDWFGSLLRSVWSGGRALISVFSLAIVTPVVAGYLIYDWNNMLAAIDNWTPPPRRPTVRALAREIDDTIGGFVRGQGTLCLILCVFYGAALTLAGLNHAILIGLAAGFISFVPYLGSITGLAVSTCVAIAQFWPNWSSIAVIPVIFIAGQSVADYVLSPYLVGRRVNLHPVWMIFALFAFGYVFGFVGLLLAVPLAAACRVLLRFALKQYYASPLYTAPPDAGPPMAKPG
jgi:predicted PurR-regulated permease PerM